MNGNVSVSIRIRPQNDREVNDICIQSDNTKSIKYYQNEKTCETFNFDYVANPKTTQNEVFIQIGVPLVETALNGYNSTLFAYGQTGSGKTYTTFGNESVEEEGVIPRSLKYLFKKIHQSESQNNSCRNSNNSNDTNNLNNLNNSNNVNNTNNTNNLNNLNKQNETNEIKINQMNEENKNVDISYSLSCSMYEIYNETVDDLLSKQIPNDSSTIQMEEEKAKKKHQNVKMPNELSQKQITSWEDTYEIITNGFKLRHTSSTLMNERSSRSHCIFVVYITKKESGNITESKLTFVDLAGSERQSTTGAKGQELKEANNINKSLLTFGKVISALLQQSNGKKDCYIPYRESKLTYFLKDSLGGNCKTFIIGTVSPSLSSTTQTRSTLRFCVMSRGINMNVTRNIKFNGTHDEMMEELSKLRIENEKLKRSQGVTIDKSEIEKANVQIKRLEYSFFAQMDQIMYLRNENKELNEKIAKQDQLINECVGLVKKDTKNTQPNTTGRTATKRNVFEEHRNNIQQMSKQNQLKKTATLNSIHSIPTSLTVNNVVYDEQKILQLEAQLKVITYRNEELQKDIEGAKEAEEKIEEKTVELMDKMNEITTLSKTLREVTEEKEKLIQQNEQLKQNAIQFVVEEFNQKIKQLELEKEGLQNALRDREEQIEELNEKNDELLRDNELLVNDVDEMNKKLNRYSRMSIRQLKEEIDENNQ